MIEDICDECDCAGEQEKGCYRYGGCDCHGPDSKYSKDGEDCPDCDAKIKDSLCDCTDGTAESVMARIKRLKDLTTPPTPKGNW